MARDRQRSKQRRRRSTQSGEDPARSRARDIGLDDASIDESGLTDTAPAPDPLKNASADADQARAATTGAGRPPAGEEIELDADDVHADAPLTDEEFDAEDDFERAPNQLETPSGLTRAGGGSGGGGGAVTARGGAEPAPHRERGRVLSFLRACIDELRRVQWPDRKHVFQATAVVLGFVLIAGGWLGLMDAIWQPLINAFL